MMHKFNLELCQILLNQTNSIDETARLMSTEDKKTTNGGFSYWKSRIIQSIEDKKLII